jgi:alpha-amylase/alpha-mannosidase (GH57 family)
VSAGVPPIDLVFLWHHHQPDYRSPRSGHALLPWVRLHATKDYLDMALHLERHPRIKATFNFVPSLLDQLDEVTAGVPDALFPLLSRPFQALEAEQRDEVLLRCASAPPWAYTRWPRYRTLSEKAGRARRAAGARESFSESEAMALETWFLLAWLDPMFHGEPEAAAALARQNDPGAAERDALLALHARLAARVIPAYRALADRGQIELSESAYYHPILPLLVSHQSARRARPQMALPHEPFAAPEDARAQVERALERHARAFGARPAGMWPPEGSVSPEVCEIVARAGVRWLATDEGVLWNSLPAHERGRGQLYRPWRVGTPAGPVALFFRDHEMSDRVGFVYHHWDAQEAVIDFIGRLRRIAQDHAGGETPVVSVILDGENCWEHYPDDGGPFLEALYRALETAPDIRTRTPSEILAERGEAVPVLGALHTGSWIDADFHIWIGHAEKNRAWDLVARTRRALVEAGSDPQRHPEAWDALAAAEGSDWFWWYGEDHFTADRALFDRIFREHLMGARERAGLPVPGELLVPVARQRLKRAGTQPQNFIHPEIDGRRTHFYEWHGAGSFRSGAGGGSMHRAAGLAREVFFGFDAERLFLRLDFNAGLPGESADLALEIMSPRPVRLSVKGLVAGERPVIWGGGARAGGPVEGARCCAGALVELAVPFATLKLQAHEIVEMIAQIQDHGVPVESVPDEDVMRFEVPDRDFDDVMWEA